MKPVQQEISSTTNGDCCRACVASILELSIKQVPNFVEGTQHFGQFWDNLSNFLAAIGYKALRIDVGRAHPYFEGWENEYVMLSGPSPRDTSVNHNVVGQIDDSGWNFKMVHDPHPSGIGIVRRYESITFLVPINASE